VSFLGGGHFSQFCQKRRKIKIVKTNVKFLRYTFIDTLTCPEADSTLTCPEADSFEKNIKKLKYVIFMTYLAKVV
jgi:hypothetical protein